MLLFSLFSLVCGLSYTPLPINMSFYLSFTINYIQMDFSLQNINTSNTLLKKCGSPKNWLSAFFHSIYLKSLNIGYIPVSCDSIAFNYYSKDWLKYQVHWTESTGSSSTSIETTSFKKSYTTQYLESVWFPDRTYINIFSFMCNNIELSNYEYSRVTVNAHGPLVTNISDSWFNMKFKYYYCYSHSITKTKIRKNNMFKLLISDLRSGSKNCLNWLNIGIGILIFFKTILSSIKCNANDATDTLF